MAGNALKISKISKYFGDKIILDEIDFVVKKGDIFGFLGLNGAGKTSLIKIILDLLDEDEGKIEIFGIDKILPNSRQKVCYLPEKFNPAANLIALEFIKFVLDFYSQKLDNQELIMFCEDFDLDIKYLDKKLNQFSKGMLQKIGLIAVFLTKADLIILDEPMSGLDLKARECLKKKLISYKNQQKTIFFSSHILSDIEEICDEIAILNQAKISFVGKSQELIKKYQTKNLEEAFLKSVV